MFRMETRLTAQSACQNRAVLGVIVTPMGLIAKWILGLVARVMALLVVINAALCRWHVQMAK